MGGGRGWTQSRGDRGDRGLDGTTAIQGSRGEEERVVGGRGQLDGARSTEGFSREGVGGPGRRRNLIGVTPHPSSCTERSPPETFSLFFFFFLYILTSFIAARRPLRFEIDESWGVRM